MKLVYVAVEVDFARYAVVVLFRLTTERTVLVDRGSVV